MKTRALKVATFVNSNLATLHVAVNDFTSGKAVTSGASGTVAYAAGEVGETDIVGQQLVYNGTNYAIALFYAG